MSDPNPKKGRIDWVPDWLAVSVICIGFVIAGAAALWLAWLALAAFLLYGYQAIQWVLL